MKLVLKATVKETMKEMRTMDKNTDRMRSGTCDCTYEAVIWNQNGVAVGHKITSCKCGVVE